MDIERWLLPEGSEDLLPPLAARVEKVRRHLDLFELWGYKYVIPPMFEYLESLLTGSGEELDLLTFKALDLYPEGRLDFVPTSLRRSRESMRIVCVSLEFKGFVMCGNGRENRSSLHFFRTKSNKCWR